MESDNKAIRRMKFHCKGMWVENPFLINAQIAQLVRVFVFENCVHNETPTKWQRRQKTGAKAGKKERNRLTCFPYRYSYRYFQLKVLKRSWIPTQ